jgi:hypothetical protein
MRRFYVGLDLGQSNDFTAIAVVEDTGEGDLHLRHLERYALGTPYPEQADRVERLMRRPELVATWTDPWEPTLKRALPVLVVDATGVGKAVVDLLKERNLRFEAVTITGGNSMGVSRGGVSVPKRDLVAALEVPFHSGDLKVAEGLADWPALKQELLSFRRKINLKTAHDSYEHWRSSDHDDLVLACALACWKCRRLRGMRIVPKAMAGWPKPRGF